MSSTSFEWTPLHLPVPTTMEPARAAITALAGLGGQPRVVLQVLGRAGQVRWLVGCDAHQTRRVLGALETHLPGARHDPPLHQPSSARADIATHVAAAIRLAGGRRLPLNADHVGATTRGVLSALSSTRSGEQVAVQLILGPRTRPSHSPEANPVLRRAVAVKAREHRFGCEIRVAATAATPARARSLIDGVAGALRGLEVPGVQVRLVRSSLRAFSAARSPYLWPNRLSISDVLPFSGWPLQERGDPPLPGIPATHPRLLPVPASVPSRGRTLGDAIIGPRPRPVAISVHDSLRHLHVLGPTGVGKSTLLAHLALDDITQGGGVVVIDPKGDLVDDLLARLDPRRLDDVVVLDARDQAPVGINGLGGLSGPSGSGRGWDPDLAADTLLGVFHSLYADSWGPRTHDILHACLLTLARRGDASLVMVPLLLTNPGFRRSVVGRQVKADPIGLGGFWSWFDGVSDAERAQAIAPLMNKLRPVLLRPGIRAVLGQRQPKFDLSDVFTQRRILLVSLGKGTIGAEAAHLLGSLVVAQLWNAALRRTALPPARRRPVTLLIDEAQDYLRVSGDVADALAQARGLGVSFTLAHQHLDQLPPPLRAAIFANARSRVAFQLTHRDARDLATTTGGTLSAEDFASLPAYQAYAHLLTDNSPTDWLSLATRPLPPPLREPRTVRARSQARYGQSLTDVEADLLALTADTTDTTPSGADTPLGRTPRRPPSPTEDPS